VQVPQVAAEVCATLHGTFQDVAMAAVGVLSHFLKTAGLSGVLVNEQDAAQRSPLAAEIAQQLESSGLLSHLPALLQHATQQLQAAAATDPMRATPPIQFECAVAMQDAHQVLDLCVRMRCLWDMQAPPASWTLSIDAAAVNLAVATVTGMDRMIRLLPGNDRTGVREPHPLNTEMLNTACTAVVQCAMRASSDTAAAAPPEPEFTELLQSPAYLQALCIALFYYMHAQLEGEGTRAGDTAAGSSRSQAGSGSQGAAAPAGSSGQSSRRRSSASAEEQHHEQQLQMEARLWAAAGAKAAALPAASQQLLQHLGCGSGKHILWTVLTAKAAGDCSMPPAAVPAVCTAYEKVVKAGMCGGLPAVEWGPEQLHKTQQLHQSLAGMLLHCAASLSQGDGPAAHACSWACVTAKWALQGVLQLHQQRQQQQQQQESQQQESQSQPGRRPAMRVPPQHPFEGLAEHLPLLKQTMAQLLRAVRQPTTTSSSDPTCSGSSGVDYISRNLALLARQEALKHAAGMFVKLGEPQFRAHPDIRLSWHANAAAAADATAGDTRDSSSSGSSSGQQHPWQPHAAEVAALLESFVRVPKVNIATGGTGPVEDSTLLLVAALCCVGDRELPNCLAATAAAAGFGSPEQQQLVELLLSMVKKAGTLGPAVQTGAEECRLTASNGSSGICASVRKHTGCCWQRAWDGRNAAAVAGAVWALLLPVGRAAALASEGCGGAATCCVYCAGGSQPGQCHGQVGAQQLWAHRGCVQVTARECRCATLL
jgi:hypothetical protein